MSMGLERSILLALQGGILSIDTLYAGLMTGDPLDGQTVDEPTDPAYTRQLVTLTEPEEEADCTSCTNATDLLFPQAGISWGTLTHIGLFASDSGGALYLYNELDQPIRVEAGDVVRFPAGSLKVCANDSGD